MVYIPAILNKTTTKFAQHKQKYDIRAFSMKNNKLQDFSKNTQEVDND